MKFKHIKHDKHQHKPYICDDSQIRHLKYIKVWDYKNEVLYQIQNGHTTKGLGYDRWGYECNEPYNNKWYKKISSNKKLNKKMTILYNMNKELEETKKVFNSEIKSIQKEFDEEINKLKNNWEQNNK